jgi:hypothetical protein
VVCMYIFTKSFYCHLGFMLCSNNLHNTETIKLLFRSLVRSSIESSVWNSHEAKYYVDFEVPKDDMCYSFLYRNLTLYIGVEFIRSIVSLD